MSNTKFPTRCYFTVCDRENIAEFRSRGANVRTLLIRNIKSALLLQDIVVVRAVSALDEEENVDVLLSLCKLIESGAIIPETRLGDRRLAEQYYGRGRQTVKLAELFDASNACQVDAPMLAYKRSLELCYHLARLIVMAERGGGMLLPGASWDNLEQIQRVLFSADEHAPDRLKFRSSVLRMFEDPEDGLRLIQSIYFGLGAGELVANPVWARSTDPMLHQAFWESPMLETSSLSAEGVRFIASAPFANMVEERSSLVLERRPSLPVEEALDCLHIPTAALDLMDAYDIDIVRRSTVGSSARAAVDALCAHLTSKDTSAEVLDQISTEFEQEHKLYSRLSSAGKWGGVGVSLLGLVPQLGILCTAAGIALGLGMESLGKKLTPLRSFSELLRDQERGVYPNDARRGSLS